MVRISTKVFQKNCLKLKEKYSSLNCEEIVSNNLSELLKESTKESVIALFTKNGNSTNIKFSNITSHEIRDENKEIQKMSEATLNLLNKGMDGHNVKSYNPNNSTITNKTSGSLSLSIDINNRNLNETMNSDEFLLKMASLSGKKNLKA